VDRGADRRRQLDQVEGVEEDAIIMPAIAQQIERRQAVVVASHSLAVDDAGARAQTRQRFDDQREAVGEIVARPAEEAHLVASLAGNDPETVVLDLVQPDLAGRWTRGLGGEAGWDEAGG
jgi:hypothetical protein